MVRQARKGHSWLVVALIWPGGAPQNSEAKLPPDRRRYFGAGERRVCRWLLWSEVFRRGDHELLRRISHSGRWLMGHEATVCSGGLVATPSDRPRQATVTSDRIPSALLRAYGGVERANRTMNVIHEICDNHARNFVCTRTRTG